jgi:hypothetical protein
MPPFYLLLLGTLLGATVAFSTVMGLLFLFLSSFSEERLSLMDTKHLPKWKSRLAKAVPFMALFVGFFALVFQTTVLYPWHEQISDDLNKLRESLLH